MVLRKLETSVALLDYSFSAFLSRIGKIEMSGLLGRLWYDEEGQDLTETALLMLLIALVAIASTRVIGRVVSNVFSNGATNHAST